MAWRDKKAKARDTVHQTMKVKCVYLADGIPLDSNSASGSSSNSGDDTYPELEVRVHEHQTKFGDQAGTSLNSAERFEANPVAIFWRAELTTKGITLARNAVISVTEGEAYLLDLIEPHDQETIKARITRLDAADAAGLPLPEA